MNKLYIAAGEKPLEMTVDLLNTMNPMQNKRKDILIGIKPNLVCASPAEEGATTHPEIIEGIIIYLRQHGFYNLKIIEGSWIGDSTKQAFKICGYEALAKKYGIPLIDLKDDTYVTRFYKNVDINICKTVFDLDFLINVPLIKGHCQTNITCALKNLKGLIPDSEKRRFHTLGLHKPIAYLNALIHQDLIVADGICPDPYFEEGGRPKKLNRIVACSDPVLMDSYAAQVLGYQINEIKYIQLAQNEGVGKPMDKDTQIVSIYPDECNLPKDMKIQQKNKKYLKIIDEADACSACFSNLASALDKLCEEGLAEAFADQICIGQAYRGYKGVLGIGDCTDCFTKHLPGCPPDTDSIIKFFKSIGSGN